MPLYDKKDREDITIEFYHKTAVYNSKITSARVPIDIKQVVKIKIRKDIYQIVVVSTKGNHYALEELILPS